MASPLDDTKQPKGLFGLCSHCRKEPWSNESWAYIHAGKSLMGDPQSVVHYSRDDFFDSIQTCSWCGLLAGSMKSPDGELQLGDFALALRDKKYSISFFLRLPRAANVSPNRISTLRINCMVNCEDRMWDLYVHFRIAARQGG